MPGTNPGTTWVSVSPTSSTSWGDVAYAIELQRFVAVGTGIGANPTKIGYSSDGVNWTVVSAPTSGGTKIHLAGVAWSGVLGLFVAVGTVGGAAPGVVYSSDGINWTVGTPPSTGAQTVSWTNVVWSPELSLFISVGLNLGAAGTSLVMTSSDGTTWTARTVANDVQWAGLCWSRSLGLLVATAVTGTAAQRVMTSSDGTTWTARTAASTNNWNEVAWSETLVLFVAVGSTEVANAIMTSSDGTTWAAAVVTSGQWFTVDWVPVFNLFLIVGRIAGTVNVIQSTNGTTWTPAAMSASSLVVYTGGVWAPDLQNFVVVASAGGGSGDIRYSSGNANSGVSPIGIAAGTGMDGGAGFVDIPLTNLAAHEFVYDDTLIKIAGNAKFAVVRKETFFMGFYKDADEIPLPVSPVDGYPYSRSEVVYSWALYSTRGPGPNFVSGQADPPEITVGQPANLYWFQADIDDSTGKVGLLVSYFAQGAVQETITKDGLVKVYALAQRASVNVPS